MLSSFCIYLQKVGQIIMTEREKSYAELLYQPVDPELVADREVTAKNYFNIIK